MSPVVYRDDEGPAWATMAIVLVVVVFALLIGYFAWWQPRNVDAEPRTDVIVQPQQPAPQSPTIVPIPVPGPAGPSGPAGPAGPAGPSGPAAPSAPSAPADPGASGTPTPGSGN